MTAKIVDKIYNKIRFEIAHRFPAVRFAPAAAGLLAD